MEAVTLVYMPKNCMYMPEPSSGDHYTLLPLTGGKDITIGVLLAFAAAKLTVASKHGSGNMGVHLKLPASFGPQPDSDDLISETALSRGPIWKNAEFVIHDGNNHPVLVNGEPMVTESTIKEARIDEYTPLNCRAWTNVAYKPKFVNNAFAFQETVTEMWQCLNRTKAEAAETKPPKPMVTDELHKEALVADQTPMFTSKSSNIDVAPMTGLEFVDPEKYWAYIGARSNPGENAAMASVGPTACAPQDMATVSTATVGDGITTVKGGTNPQCQRDANPPCDPTRLYEALGQMNNSLEHLEQGYFASLHETVRVTREILADLNEVDATYVETVLEAMRKWQADVTLMVTAIHTDACTVWDTNRNAIDDATWDFRKVCEASRMKHAKDCEAHQKAVAEGKEKDPVIELLDKVPEKTRVVANQAVDAFQKQFKKALVPHVPAEHLPVLGSNAYNTVSQFCMAIWWMVADECIMPMWHDYLTNFGLATIMQHTLEKVPITCMRIMLPHPPEPKDDLTTFLDSLGNTPLPSASMEPMTVPAMVLPDIPAVPGALAMGSLGMGPATAATAPVFWGVPLTPVLAGMVTGVSLFQTSTALPPGFAPLPPSISLTFSNPVPAPRVRPLPTSVSLTSTSSAPAAISTPKGSGLAATLPVSISLLGHPGGRTEFLTNPIQAGNLGDLDEEVDKDLKRLAGSVAQKHTPGSKRAHDDDIDENDEAKDGNGSMLEDLDKPAPVPAKRGGKAKSPAKSGPAHWPTEEIDVVHQNRYKKDRPEMIEYHQKYLSDDDQTKFNLKNHTKYM